MEAKKSTATIEVTERAAQAALRRDAARSSAPHAPLASDEEKVLRMRLGASLPRSAALGRLATASDEEIDLLAIEIETYLALKARGLAPTARPAVAPARAPTASRTKEKIVRALRRK